MPRNSTDEFVAIFHDVIVGLCRREAVDLTARQLAVFLTCYMTPVGQTVRGLAAHLNISKPAVTRALDKLEKFHLARRKIDLMDRRSVLVTRTMQGAAFLRELRSFLATASKDHGVSPSPPNAA
jgi:DNA-binding MarR family transcriptional regulator